MGTISVTLPTDGTTADVSDYNTPINTIVTAINGNLDNSNISNLSGSKITAGTLPGSALDSTSASGWFNLNQTPATVTYNGNNSYSLVFNSVDLTGTLSTGMRLRSTRSVTAPIQCTLLNGSTQYYSKSSPAGMTFTNFPVAGAWIKLNSYSTSKQMIESRYNGTSGWACYIDASGAVNLTGYNAGSANFNTVTSYQSIPLGKWVHVAAQLDMSTSTLDGTHSYIMINGISVPAFKQTGGTNPTSLVQAGNLEVGSTNSGTLPFNGSIAQAFVFSAAVSQATLRSYITQGFAGTETSLISAYSFNNSINDLNVSNANNLTANGSAVATAADSPFTQDDTGKPTGTIDCGVVTSKVFSTNTTITVQVPEGCTLPTSGGISTVQYSTYKVPYGFPVQRHKWRIGSLYKDSQLSTSNATYGAFVSGSRKLNVPLGEFVVGWKASLGNSTTTAVIWNLSSAVLTGLASNVVNNTFAMKAQSSAAAYTVMPGYTEATQSVAAQIDYILYSIGTTTGGLIDGTIEDMAIFAECAYI